MIDPVVECARSYSEKVQINKYSKPVDIFCSLKMECNLTEYDYASSMLYEKCKAKVEQEVIKWYDERGIPYGGYGMVEDVYVAPLSASQTVVAVPNPAEDLTGDASDRAFAQQAKRNIEKAKSKEDNPFVVSVFEPETLNAFADELAKALDGPILINGPTKELVGEGITEILNRPPGFREDPAELQSGITEKRRGRPPKASTSSASPIEPGAQQQRFNAMIDTLKGGVAEDYSPEAIKASLKAFLINWLGKTKVKPDEPGCEIYETPLQVMEHLCQHDGLRLVAEPYKVAEELKQKQGA